MEDMTNTIVEMLPSDLNKCLCPNCNFDTRENLAEDHSKNGCHVWQWNPIDNEWGADMCTCDANTVIPKCIKE